jgi:membrane protein DedA with SNARE-associated domain
VNHEQTLLYLIEWIKDWGYIAIFFGIMLENAGIPAPGELIIIGGAVLSGKGAEVLTGAPAPLKIQFVYLWAVLGAILGDNIGYWLGATGGRSLFLKAFKPFGVNEAKMTAAERAFEGRAEWGVFLGRFVTILRIFAGPLAGIVRMPYHKFVFFNAAGAIVWVAVVAGLSYAFSEELELILLVLRRLGYVGLAVFSCVVAFFIIRRHRRRHSKA